MTQRLAPVHEPPAHAMSPSELAAMYGLSVSGARPGLVAYTRQLWGRRHFINEFAK
ncbi:ABC transporter permease, partial [Streptomyces sp. NPDC087270]